MSEQQPVIEELPLDTSDPKSVQKQVKSAKQRDALLAEALRGIMGTEPGRAWVHSVLVRCHPYESAFSRDPLMMAHNCGEANIGLQLVAELHACSTELYLQMMKENSDG